MDTPYKLLTSALGIPESELHEQLGPLIEKTGKKPNELGLEDLRSIVAEYLQDTFVELKERGV